MKRRSAFVVPAIAAVLAGAIIAFVGPFQSPTTRAASSLAFEAKFETAGDFFNRFDYGLSGVAQSDSSVNAGAVNFHGDHDSSCGAPTTLRDVHLSGGGPNTDFSQLVWYCAPGGDATKGHIMTGLNTFGYNHFWFSPKPTFTSITKVCWDINETEESSRKWTELQFVGDADAHRYPTGSVVDTNVWARGTGGFDLGYTDIGFRGGDSGGPSTGLVPQGGTLAGLKDFRSIFSYFENETQGTADGVGWPGNLGNGDPAGVDKATRYKHCLSNNPDGQTMTLVSPTPHDPTRTLTLAGQIPQDSRRVVFHDSVYDAPKGDQYNADFLTWHWDNIQVFTDSDGPVTTTAPPTTEPPTTEPPTTEPPTTEPPTTEPPTTMPPTTEPPTTEPPTTEPPTTMPPTTEPPTTEPPTTEPPTTMPPTTEPPTTEPPTTEPPTTMPPTTEPPTTEPPTTMPPTTEPPTTEPTTTPPSTSAPGAPIVTITSGPDETTTDPDATIAFEVVDGQSSDRAPLALTDGASITCSLDGAAAEPCSSPVHYQDLALGEHKVVVTATDGANDQGSATHVWSVVAVAGPTTNPTSPPPTAPSVTSALQHGVLPLTGTQSTRLAIVGLMMIFAGLLLGSVFAIGRRLHP